VKTEADRARGRAYDARRREKAPWRGWYREKDWFRIRHRRLNEERYCRMCAAAGVRRLATIVDHIKRHGGDRRLFFAFDNTQSLCEPHHNSSKQRQEARGYSDELGLDGLPVDPNHPFNRG
jgi:hypothetical protein